MSAQSATWVLCVGSVYHHGEDWAKDSAKAGRLYQRAADGGDMEAVYDFGCLYEVGDGAAKDIAKACKLYQRAADDEITDAYSLGFKHENGDGVENDLVTLAYELNTLAEGGRDTGASFHLSRM